MLVRKLDEAVSSSGDMGAALAALADDVAWYEIGRAEPTVGPQALGERFANQDYEVTSETHDIVGNGEHVVQLLNNTATRNKVTARWAFRDDSARIADFFG